MKIQEEFNEVAKERYPEIAEGERKELVALAYKMYLAVREVERRIAPRYMLGTEAHWLIAARAVNEED